jgi:homoserine O-succinyltransferase/O-acetyltransferase
MNDTKHTLHIGLLNMMADGALAATERQFQRLLDGPADAGDDTPRCVLHPFSFPEIPRSETGRAYVSENYEDFAAVSARGLDAMIITGANIPTPGLREQPFWDPLIAVMEWARTNVRSTLCSCLATHAVMEFRYRRQRSRMPRKLWGVYPHEVLDRKHALTHGLDERVDVPHSRFNEITDEQFEAAGLRVLVAGPECGVHLVVEKSRADVPSPLVMFQGHPEYDNVSLLKEYRREISRYVAGERDDYPPLLDFTLDEIGERMCRDHWREVMGRAAGAEAPEFPEEALLAHVMGTWHAAVEIVFRNWVRTLI